MTVMNVYARSEKWQYTASPCVETGLKLTKVLLKLKAHCNSVPPTQHMPRYQSDRCNQRSHVDFYCVDVRRLLVGILVSKFTAAASELALDLG